MSFSDSDRDDSRLVLRDGKFVVSLRQSQYPSRCVRCNGALDRPMKTKNFEWQPPLKLLLKQLIGIIDLSPEKSSARITFGICRRHRRIRWLQFAFIFLSPFVGLGCTMLGLLVSGRNTALLYLTLMPSIAVVFLGPVLFWLRQPLAPVRMTEDFIWMRAGSAFVASLQESPPIYQS